MTIVSAQGLIGVANVVWAERNEIGADARLRELVGEVAGLLDCVGGLNITNPEQRAEAHMAAINRMAADLPRAGR